MKPSHIASFCIGVFWQLNFFNCTNCLGQNDAEKAKHPLDFFRTSVELYAALSQIHPNVESMYQSVEIDGKIGYKIGAGITFPLNPHFEISSRLLHEQNGMKGSYSFLRTFDGGYSEGREHFHLKNYYSSVSATLNYWSGPRNNLGIGVGGYFGLLHSSKLTTEQINRFDTKWITNFLINEYKDFDAGITISLNYRLRVSNQVSVNMGLQHDLGIVNIIKDAQANSLPIVGPFDDPIMKRRSLSVYAGIISKLPKASQANGIHPLSFKHRMKTFFSEAYLLAGPAISLLRGIPMLENTTLTTRKSKTSFAYGVGASHPIGDHYFLDIQLFSENKGGTTLEQVDVFDQQTQTTSLKEIAFEMNYRCVTVPLVIHYAVGNRSQLKIGGGLFGSYLYRVVNYFDPNPRKIDAGIIFSVGYQVPLSSLLSFDVRAINTNGLLNVSRLYDHGSAIKTNITCLVLGIRKKIQK
jgi:hypothetical protein